MPFSARKSAVVSHVVASAIGIAATAAHATTPYGPTAAPEQPTLSSSDLETRGITALDGVAAALPEISAAPTLNSLTTLRLYMRGEGPVAPGQITLDGAVGIYQDGFYISRLQANTFDLLDLECVDVLAGPQGADYGRDSTGGVIKLISRAPAASLRFTQDVDFGNRNSYRVLSSLDTPGWHGLAAKVTLLASSVDGYVTNKLANSHDYGSEKRRAVRLRLRWDALSSLSADYFLERSGLDSTPEYDSNPQENDQEPFPGFFYYADPNGPMRSTYRPINLPLSTSNHTAQGLTLNWEPWSALRVQSLTGYRTMNANEQQDYAEVYGYPSATRDLYNLRQFSQALSVSGELYDGQLGYLAGVSYFKEKGEHGDDFVLLSQGASEQSEISAATRSQAVYARLHWHPRFLSRRLEITAAGRYTRDSKDATRSMTENHSQVLEADAPNHVGYNRATPELVFTWHWSDHIATYAKGATGYVAGGALETAPIGSFSSTAFRPESSTTYELGLVAAFRDDLLRATLALFDSRRKDVQYALPVDRLTDDVLDFQRVTVKGASFDLRAAPVRDLMLRASATYQHWSIDRADAPAGTIFDPGTGKGSAYVVGQNINTLFTLPYAPEYSAALATDYTLAHLDRKDLLLHLDYVYRGAMFAEAGAGPGVPGNRFDTQPSYGLFNGRITLSQETEWAHRVKFSIWGRNILNRKYYQPAFGAGAGLTTLDTTGKPSGYLARIGAWAEPRSYGLAIRYEY